MYWLDIVIVVVIIIFAIVGLRQGAIKTVFAIGGLIGGIALAGRYHEQLASVLSPEGAAWAGIAAFAIILVVTIAIASVVGWLVAKLARVIMLGWLDKVIGFILGGGIGGMLCAAILAIASKYLPGIEGAISQSAVARLLMEQFPLLLALLPEQFDFIRDFFAPSP